MNRCLCLGEEAIELCGPTGTIATVGLHHGQSIRWAAWQHDAVLADGPRLLHFLADQGVGGPLERYEQILREADEAAQAATRWREAMPACLIPFWENMNSIKVDVGSMHVALEASLPDPRERALAMFRWLGSGVGPWSEFPVYECVVERLLVLESTAHLVATLSGASETLNSADFEGAARYFSGTGFWLRKRNEHQLVPNELRARLLSHVRRSGDPDKVERMQAALPETDTA